MRRKVATFEEPVAVDRLYRREPFRTDREQVEFLMAL